MQDADYQNAQTYFLTFCIEHYKHENNLSGFEVKAMFDSYGVTNYLSRNYDVLHTQSKQWILDDIKSFINSREKSE